MADEEPERLTIRELLRRGGYLITIPKPRPEEASLEVEILRPSREPGRGDIRAEESAIGAGEELRKKLDALVMKMVKTLREEQGDVMLLSDFVTNVLDEFEKEHGSILGVDDVLISINELARKGLIAGVLTLDSGARIIRLSPEEFGVDELKVLDVVSKREPPEITLEELARETGWPPARARAALKALEKARVARHIPGSFTGEQDKWCFPGLEKKI